MRKPAPTEGLYVGRRADCVVKVLNMDREAAALLTTLCSKKLHGHFLSRLVYEHVARKEERARLRTLLEEEEVSAPGG